PTAPASRRKPGPTHPPSRKLTGGSRLSPGRRINASPKPAEDNQFGWILTLALLGLDPDHARGGAGADPAQRGAAPSDRRSRRARRDAGALLLWPALCAGMAGHRLAGDHAGPAIAGDHRKFPDVDGGRLADADRGDRAVIA